MNLSVKHQNSNILLQNSLLYDKTFLTFVSLFTPVIPFASLNISFNSSPQKIPSPIFLRFIPQRNPFPGNKFPFTEHFRMMRRYIYTPVIPFADCLHFVYRETFYWIIRFTLYYIFRSMCRCTYCSI